MTQPMDVCNDADTSAHVRQSYVTGRQLPATPTASEIGRKRTCEYLRDVFEAPPKSRRLEIASEIKSLETEHYRTVNCIKKSKHQIRQLAAKLEADETQRARLNERIRALKFEDAAE